MKIAMLVLCALPVIAAAQASAPSTAPTKQGTTANSNWKEESTPAPKQSPQKSRADVKGELKQSRASGNVDATNVDSYGTAPPSKSKAPKPEKTRKEAKDDLAKERKAGTATPKDDETYGEPTITPPPKTKQPAKQP